MSCVVSRGAWCDLIDFGTIWDSVTARLGPGPNEGSAVIITWSFMTEPQVFCLVSPHVVLLETWYKLVELVQGPRVRVQQRLKIYGDIVYRITSGLIRVYKMG